MTERLPPPPPFADDPRPVALVYRAPLFNASETFVRAQAAGLSRYQPLVVGREAKGHVPPALADRLLFRPAIEALRRYRPTLIHAHFGPDGLSALPLAEALAVPLITSLRGYDVTRTRGALLRSGHWSWLRYALGEGRLQRGGTLFLAVSDALRTQAIARGYPATRTRTHYNGVDLARFPAGPGGEDLILFVGRLVEKKGLDMLLRAFAEIRQTRPRTKLVLIGEGPLDPRGDGVRRLGALPHAEVADWMRRATLLAAPSVTARDGDAEGLPNVVVEAGASALPVVGTRHGGIPEAVTDGETGLLVAERDAAGLAAAMSALLGNRSRRDAMGAAARALAEARFDFARQMERLEAIYDEVRRCA
jgi:glycosyltransferase involved in cell wall biosynthesis